eukprot:SAG11_NODE_36_length_21869_cov_38.038999_12_plen_89_part_00
MEYLAKILHRERVVPLGLVGQWISIYLWVVSYDAVVRVGIRICVGQITSVGSNSRCRYQFLLKLGMAVDRVVLLAYYRIPLRVKVEHS